MTGYGCLFRKIKGPAEHPSAAAFRIVHANEMAPQKWQPLPTRFAPLEEPIKVPGLPFSRPMATVDGQAFTNRSAHGCTKQYLKYLKWKLPQHRLQHRNQPGLADILRRSSTCRCVTSSTALM